MPHKKSPAGPRPVEAIRHEDKRLNIPTADAHDLVDEETARAGRLVYPRRADLDPQLVWNGKDYADAADLIVDAPPIYIQEKIDPRVIIENLRRTADKPEDEPELTLFDDFDGLSGWKTVEFYQHEANWSNRMILGDSLQVMASLVEKENLRGKVQMIYIDPPYGIKFGSNWQVSVTSRDVKDGKLEDTTREAEQIKAFRDTWEKGIHSYLEYLRDRLVVARDLLTESGSVFIQIGDENVHLVRCLLDEIFGSENFIRTIIFTKTSSSTSSYLGGTTDFIHWYAKDVNHLKYRRLLRLKQTGGEGTNMYRYVELPDGSRRAATPGELADPQTLPQGARLYRRSDLRSQAMGRAKGEGAASWFHVETDGVFYNPGPSSRWKTNETGMTRLKLARRLEPGGKSLNYVRYLDDFPAFPYTEVWNDVGGVPDRAYVVETNETVISRCLLMTTDPGDLVLDPTCGSGTTAYVAEQWGRRWMAIDTSRVALTLARQRIMGAKFPYYLLADTPEGRAKEQELTGQPQPVNGAGGDVRKGFVYQRVLHVKLRSIVKNPDIKEGMSRAEIDAAIKRHAEQELLYDRPFEDKNKVRVPGPFTVESLSPHRAIAPDAQQTSSEKAASEEADAASFEHTVLENLEKAGVQNGRKAERLEFEGVVTYPGVRIQAEGFRKNGEEGTPQRIAISIGPQYGTVDSAWVKAAAREALKGRGFDLLLVCAFAFDPQALKTTEEFAPSDQSNFAVVQEQRKAGKLPISLVRMNSDLAMGDVLLKKTGSGNLFTVFGAPDVEIMKRDDGLVVQIRGVDVYNPTTGEIRSSGTEQIALWMIDTNYDEESFFVRHCYFTGGNDPYKKLKTALKADIDETAWQSLYSTTSRSFPEPETGKIAIKVINHYGDEVLQVYDV